MALDHGTRYDNHSATDPLYTAVKVALSAHGAEDLEDDLELAKCLGRKRRPRDGIYLYVCMILKYYS